MVSSLEHWYLSARWQLYRQTQSRQIYGCRTQSASFWHRPLVIWLCLAGVALVGVLCIHVPTAIASPTVQPPARVRNIASVATASPIPGATTPATLFEENCAGCHVNGGNVIRRGKNLKKKAMVRNGYESVDAITQIIANGKGIMSAYGDRLNEEEISAIAQYVHEQSESGW
ncbi:MAG: c-type cytochrome [Cyanobacteria bacterium J06648_10]